jgi:hypothetical protein
MRQVYRSIAAIYGTPKVEIGSRTQPGTAAYNAACLSGYDPALSDNVRAEFRLRGASATLQYELGTEAEMDKPELSFGREAGADDLALMSESMRSCVAALAKHGFRLRHVSNEHGTRVVLACGRPVGTMGFVLGATVELRS